MLAFCSSSFPGSADILLLTLLRQCGARVADVPTSRAGVFTVLIGVCHESFPATMCMMILSGIFLEAGCGATYGVVPFVSRRSTGIVCGLVSAGGACGGVINQALFFLNTPAKGAYGERTPQCWYA